MCSESHVTFHNFFFANLDIINFNIHSALFAIQSTLLFCVEGYEVAAKATMAALRWLKDSGFIM